MRSMYPLRATICGSALAGLAFCAPAFATEPAGGSPALDVRNGEDVTALSLGNGAAFHTTTNEVRDPRIVEVPGTSILLTLWDEMTAMGLTSFYAISLDGSSTATVRETSYELMLDRLSFDPAAGEPSFAGSPLGAGQNLYLVQFVTQPLEAFRNQLTEMGAKVHSYIARHAYVVRMDAATRARVETLPYVRWVGQYHPEFRVEQHILDGVANGTLEAWQRYQIMLPEQDDGQKAVLANQIARVGGQVVQFDAGSSFLQAFLSPEQLTSIVGMDQLLFMDRLGEYEPDMSIARQLHGSLYLENQTGWDGEGMRGEVADTGCYTTHPDFNPGPPLCYTSGSAGCSPGSHGTNVHGIIFGDGGVCARGTLKAHEQDYYCTTSAWTGSGGSPGYSGRYAHTGLMVGTYKCLFQTNSTGSPRTYNYTTVSAQMDELVFDHDTIVCQSQSNAGNQDSRPQSWAKNVVGVGGINHENTLTMSDDNWSYAGSTGPASDGRIQPDLASFYDYIDTTSGSSSCTSSFGGTSGATPITCGHLSLVFQMWHNGIWGNPTGATVFDSRCHFTTARALAINSAEQWTFSGSSHDLSRDKQGWGHVDLETLYDYAMASKMMVVDETDVLTPLGSTAYNVTVNAGEPWFKATLVYADTDGNPAVQSQHRVNDLTLKVVSPGGTTYWGNNNMRANMWTPAGGSANDKDTVENVFVQNPQSGTWVVTISADEINEDTHPETGALDADYALVVSGGVGTGGGCIDPTIYCTGKLTSQWTMPAIGFVGNGSISANNLKINVTGFLPNKPATVFWGTNPNNLPFHGGYLCVLPPIKRGTPLQLDPTGAGEWQIDISGQVSGTYKYYQTWARDPFDFAGFGDSLSDAVSVKFCD